MFNNDLSLYIRPSHKDARRRRNALMRFARNGANQLQGEALQRFNKHHSAARAQLFEIYMSSQESWESVSVWVEQQMQTEEKTESSKCRVWKSRTWLLKNKYDGDEQGTDNAVQNLARTPGFCRLDPDGSGTMEYYVLLEDKGVQSNSMTNRTTMSAEAALDRSAAGMLMQDNNPLFGNAARQRCGGFSEQAHPQHMLSKLRGEKQPAVDLLGPASNQGTPATPPDAMDTCRWTGDVLEKQPASAHSPWTLDGGLATVNSNCRCKALARWLLAVNMALLSAPPGRNIVPAEANARRDGATTWRCTTDGGP